LTAIPLVSLLLFGSAIIIGYVFVFGFAWGAGYYPTPAKAIDDAGKLLDPKEGDRVFDLGCGFGKVVLRLAKRYPNVYFTGVEVDPIKFLWCKLAIRANHLGGRVEVVRENLLRMDLSDASGIFVFLSRETSIMDRLQKKVFAETREGTKVVSYVHKFKHWTPSERVGETSLYVVPRRGKLEEEQEKIA